MIMEGYPASSPIFFFGRDQYPSLSPTSIFGLLAYVIVPGLLVMWDRVLDHMEDGGRNPK